MKEDITTQFRRAYPYIEASDETIWDAYRQVPERIIDTNQILDLMQDYILSQDLAEEVVP